MNTDNNNNPKKRKRIVRPVGEPMVSKINIESIANEATFTKSYNKPSFQSYKPKSNDGSFNKSKPWDKKYSKPNGFSGNKKYDPKEHDFFKAKVEKSDEDILDKLIVPKDDIRLNKYISNSGLCSRREADTLIEKGYIKVNNEVVTTLGYRLSPNDKVEYKDKLLKNARLVYLVLNKPKDTITTTDDPEERKTVMDYVKNATSERIYPIGRLDRNTTGVLIFTNDGEFAQVLSHPSNEVKKIYYAELDKPLSKVDYESIMKGVMLEDGLMMVDELAYVNRFNETQLGIQIHSGKNRIIHRLFNHLGYKLKKLDRVVYAGVDKGGLKKGFWRFLNKGEVQTILNNVKKGV